jgi:uncharacterized protein YjbI with pentapeptide repeats
MADEPRDEAPAEEPKYDQEFFIALALKGKDAWDAWRRDPANKYVHVTFAGVDFSEAPRDQIDFSGFEFGAHADFSKCKWRGVELMLDPKLFKPGRACFYGAAVGDRADFSSAVFGSYATFAYAAFGDRATFIGAAYGRGANFSDTTFGEEADFTGASFNGAANFTGASFGARTNFTIATFGCWARFTSAIFDDNAVFKGAAFGDGGNFGQTHFKGKVQFTGISDWQNELASAPWIDNDIRAVIKQRYIEIISDDDSGPNRFLTISFANAHFDADADYSGRYFLRASDFTGVRFYYPPDFDAAANVFRIDFTGAQISFVRPGRLNWTFQSRVIIQLRAFRKIAEETKNHDLERDLY